MCDICILRPPDPFTTAAEVGGLLWSYATGLTGTDGQLTGSSGSFTLVLDTGAGSGLTSAVSVLPDSDGDGVSDGCDVCEGFDDNVDTDGDGAPDECDACVGGAGSGDTNGDGAVDLADYVDLNACLLGPGGGIGPGCDCFDSDTDGDVTLADFGDFQVSLTVN